jgi:hypothetical protein
MDGGKASDAPHQILLKPVKELAQSELQSFQLASLMATTYSPPSEEISDVGQRIKAGYANDLEVVTLLNHLKNPKLEADSDIKRKLKLLSLSDDGYLLRSGLIYVPDDSHLKIDILKGFHDNEATGGHWGRFRTIEHLSRNFYWPCFRAFVS